MAPSAGRLLVVGPTGNVGRPVVEHLLAAGASVRAAVHDPGGGAAVLPAEVECVHLDLEDPSSFAATLAGVRGLFLLRPPPISRVGPTLNALVDVAYAAGVEHVVFLSVAGADTNRVVPHHRVERHLAASEIGWTILRPGFFAQNLGDAYRRDIAEDDRLSSRPARAGWRGSTCATSASWPRASCSIRRRTAGAATR